MALQVWLPLNGTLENKGLSNVTVTNSGATVDNNGKIGKCYYFNGSKYLIGNGPLSNSTLNFSIAFWVKYDNLSNYHCMYSQRTITGEGISVWKNGNHIRFDDGSNLWETPYTITANVWIHVAVTRTSSEKKLYINGELKSTTTSGSLKSVSSKFVIGMSSPNNDTTAPTDNHLYGRLNDVRIYNHALSDKEVKEISKGLILHYKLDGNDIGITIPRNGDLIPDGIELYDYILSSGTLWIDTLYKPNNNTRIICDFQFTTSNDCPRIFGCSSGISWNSTPNFQLNFETGVATGKLGVIIGNNNSWTRTNITGDFNRHTYDLATTRLIYDGTQVATYPNQTFQCTTNLPIFVQTTSNINLQSNEFAIGKLYSFQIYENNQLVKNLLPCTYLGEPGMWDTVENKFYRNQGTGLFTLGNKITLKEYESLTSDGNAYIDTLYIPNNNTKIDLKFNHNRVNEDLFVHITAYRFGNYNTTNGFLFLRYKEGGLDYDSLKVGLGWPSGASTTISLPAGINQSTVDFKNKICTLNGSLYTTLVDFSLVNMNLATMHLPIFAICNNTKVTTPKMSKPNIKNTATLYYYKIFNNDILVRDFIPVSYNGTPGLWDKVEWKFYANAGSGSFTLGPEKIVQQDAPIFHDSSGYCNHGSITGTLTTNSNSPRYTASTMFDGNTSCISVPYNSVCPSNIFTINLWFKKDAIGTKNFETLFGGPSGFEMDTRASNASTLCLYMTSSRGGKRNLVTNISLGNWYMITMTRSNIKERYYVNGIFQSEIDVVSMPTGNYFIGAWNTSTSQNYYGLISDFRIYSTVLTDEDILELYNTSAFVTNNGVFAEYELYEDNLSDVKKTGLLETADFYENGAESGYALDTDKTRVASNYIISEEFIEI